MDPAAIAALVQLGLSGIVLYLFFTDKLRTKAACDESQAQSDARLAELRRLYEARIKAGDERLVEQKQITGEWKALALGTERRLDAVTPLVATAVGAPVPSAPPTEARGT